MECEVVIIGAGVLGVSLAFHLSNFGCQVVLIDREATYASHASGKNAGMFRQLYRNSSLTDWAHRSRQLWPESVRSVAFKETGSLIVGRSAPEHHQELFINRCVNTALGAKEAVYTPTDGLLDPHLYVSSIFKLIDRRFVKICFRETVSAIESHVDGQWRIRCESGLQLKARMVVNAAGAWLNSFISSETQRVAAAPFARHLFVVEGFEPEYMPQQNAGFYWDEFASWYLRRWDKSTRLVSICDRDVSDPDHFVRRDKSVELSEKLLSAIPAVAPHLKLVRGWHCFRTYTNDQLPLWGFDAHGVFWLAAFGGFGMSTSFAAALDAAALITNQTKKDYSEFSPKRAQGVSDEIIAA